MDTRTGEGGMGAIRAGIGRRINLAVTVAFVLVLLVGGVSVLLAWTISVGVEDDEAGHHADGGARVYKGNKMKDGAPELVWKGTPANPPAVDAARASLFLLSADAAPYGPTNSLTGKPGAKGDKVPVAILQNPTGSNADIKAHGRWLNGVWTLEMSRALNPGPNTVKDGKTIDMVFQPGKTYHFGISVFDSAEAIDHSFADVLTWIFR